VREKRESGGEKERVRERKERERRGRVPLGKKETFPSLIDGFINIARPTSFPSAPKR